MAVNSPEIQNQELRVESRLLGRPVRIALDYTTVGDVTPLHVMTADDVVDKVWVTLWNRHSAAIIVSIIVSPSDDTVVGDVDAATITALAPVNLPLELPPMLVRLNAGNAYTIAAHVITAEVDLVRVTTRIVRYAQGELVL